MPATLDVSCPNCGKALKVPAEFEGKKIKCKDCQQVFAVKAAAKPVKAATAPAPPPPPEAPVKPKSPFLDDDDDLAPGERPKSMGVVQEEDVPRCPHCAKELDPPTAIVCTNCGFNNKTRVKAETRKTYAADASDWTTHLLPGIVALIIAVALIVLDIICLINMSEWVAGSDLEKEEKDPVTGNTQYYVKPGALTTLIIALTVLLIIPCLVFAYRRLLVEYKPEEKVKK